MAKFVYVGAAGAPATGSGPKMQGAYRLDAASGKWEQMAGGLPANVEVRATRVQPGSPNIVYLGSGDGLWRSDDAGTSWKHLPLPGKDKVVWSILIHPKDPDVLLVGTEVTTVYRSENGGKSFTELKVPAPGGVVKMNFPTRVLRIVMAPQNPDEIYVALEVGGMVRSLDGGKTWDDCNPNLLAFTEQPKYRSKIGSDTETEGMMDSHALAASGAQPGVVFLANRMGLFRSQDRAKTWKDMEVGRFSPLTYARDVQISPHNPNTMYAALSVAAVSDAGSLYRSDDHGETWKRFDHGVSIDSTLMTISPSHSDAKRVYCAARRGQVFGTEDGGATWKTYQLPDGAQGIELARNGLIDLMPQPELQAKALDGDFDYIVVGAGTAGCILANRLSADPKKRVLLLEAGGKDDWIWFHIPVGYLFAIGNPRSDWMFKTESEPGLNGRALAYPRGKVIGGSSAINAMISMRGQAADYDHWRQLGLTGWGWDDVRPVFRRLEDHFLGDSEHHGAGGGWRVEEPRLSWEVLDAVGNAAREMGIPKLADFNTGNNEGFGYFHVNQKRGRRWSAARGFLKPVLDRPNLRLLTNVLADKLIVEQSRAAGVRFFLNNEVFEARTNGEVILAAGSIGSTQILHRSGIGPHEWLAPLGIDVVLDRQGVGRNLQDHLQQRAIFKVHGVRTLNETYHSLIRRGLMGLDYLLRRRGPLTMAPSQLGIFTRSDAMQERANIQFHIQPLSLDKFGDPLHRFPAITASACNLRPTSRGTIKLRGASPTEAPLIAPNYLATPDDRQVAADAIRVTRKLMKQHALAKYRPEEFLPGPSVGDDDDALAKAAGDIGTTIFHPVGTAKMGADTDPLAVVDERLRLHGIGGLRVVDASVMPTITSGNTNTPTAMIAEKGSTMIVEDGK